MCEGEKLHQHIYGFAILASKKQVKVKQQNKTWQGKTIVNVNTELIVRLFLKIPVLFTRSKLYPTAIRDLPMNCE